MQHGFQPHITDVTDCTHIRWRGTCVPEVEKCMCSTGGGVFVFYRWRSACVLQGEECMCSTGGGVYMF